MLNRLGYGQHQIDMVDDGENGVEAVIMDSKQQLPPTSGNRPSNSDMLVVFMDIYMPVMNGLEATRAIRSHPELQTSRQPYIIALTANAMSGDQAECLQHGMDAYLSKPVTMEILSRALRDVVFRDN